MAVVERHGLPIAVTVASATPHEVTLVEAQMMDLRKAGTHAGGD